MICQHKYFGKLIINRGSENKETVAELAQRYEVKKMVVSAYHPYANEMIDCGHKAIIDALSKMTDGESTNRVRNLPTILWADQSTVLRSTGLTPYYISCGSKPILPIELEILTWQILP